ncbi:hypothetical protein F4821DRAFT_229101 [Hypoxylon rubiginosum]|uniref:Uncharacterized protein n=1 Tax=Hypoxylon rubiginosum TaxID=110542 RepID=A0ACC0DCI4_9PEZI|nr:hypothetical protein F4821DRAFT_229101 [Hypoxylon rubiginosum]
MSSPDSTIASSGPFPLEIIEQIVYYLSHDWINLDGQIEPSPRIFRNWRRIRGVARYATVNKVWQVAVERETFAELRLDLGRLAEADVILNGVPRRQKYVGAIRLNVVLPLKDGKRGNRALQDTFEAFLSTLSHWTPGPPVKLCLDAYDLTKEGYREKPWLRVSRSCPKLEDPERVLRYGPVNVVTELDMESNRLVGRPMSAVAVCTFLARLPAAKNVSINWRDSRGYAHAESRKAFSQALNNVTHAIDYFQIAGTYSLPNCQRPARQPDQSEAGPDELSQSLGIISQRVRNIDLCEVAVSDDIFLQYDLPPEIASPAHWARLENFFLQYTPVTPSGKWLFYRDPSAPDVERAAIIADPAVQRRYLVAARAALEMPLLQSMLLVAYERCNDAFNCDWHTFCYYREGARAVWSSSSGFVPNDEVLAAWREVPRKYLDDTELEVVISDDEHAA